VCGGLELAATASAPFVARLFLVLFIFVAIFPPMDQNCNDVIAVFVQLPVISFCDKKYCVCRKTNNGKQQS
jgi:hypothetical protein